MLYETKTWTIAGECEIGSSQQVILNPTIKVTNVSFSSDLVVVVSTQMTENGGIYKHHFTFVYTNATQIADVNDVVDAALVNQFPTITEI